MSQRFADGNVWLNEETYAVARHIRADQGWQESVHEALREAREGYRLDNDEATDGSYESRPHLAGEVIRENAEGHLLDWVWADPSEQMSILHDIGSLWRVDWTELGSAFLEDLRYADAPAVPTTFRLHGDES